MIPILVTLGGLLAQSITRTAFQMYHYISIGMEVYLPALLSGRTRSNGIFSFHESTTTWLLFLKKKAVFEQVTYKMNLLSNLVSIFTDITYIPKTILFFSINNVHSNALPKTPPPQPCTLSIQYPESFVQYHSKSTTTLPTHPHSRQRRAMCSPETQSCAPHIFLI